MFRVKSRARRQVGRLFIRGNLGSRAANQKGSNEEEGRLTVEHDFCKFTEFSSTKNLEVLSDHSD